MSAELDLARRIAALPPERRRLFEARLARQGLRRSRARAVPRRPPDATGPFPLTWGQQRLWFVDRMIRSGAGRSAYNIPFAGRLRGALDARWLARALAEVVRRHEVLRSRFPRRDGLPVQVVDPPPARVALPVVDLSGLAPARRDAEAARLIDHDPHVVFDLERGPVYRLTLLRLVAGPAAPPEHWLLVTMAHLVTDAWSMAVLFRELPALYDALRHGRPSPLPELPIQVVDYALWQRDYLAGPVLEEQVAFWREHLAGAPTVLELPTDRPRPPQQSLIGRRHYLTLPKEATDRLRPLAESEGATLFMVLLAVFGVLLARRTGQDDLLVSSPVATRSEPETHGLIGFFIDNAVLRVDLSGRPTFRELVARVRESAVATFGHTDLPFDKVIEAVGVPRDLSRPPLVQVNFVLQNVHIPAPAFEGLELVHSQQTDTRAARFELGLGLFEEEGVYSGAFEYATALFDDTTIGRMVAHLERLVREAAAEPERPVAELAMLGRAERHQLVVEWAAGAVPPAASRMPFHRQVAERAAAAPAALAVAAADGRRVSYGELAAAAGRLARRLRDAGLRPEEPVAVVAERTPETIAALLAVLAAGGVYLPLDHEAPAERVARQLADAGARIVLGRPPAVAALGLEPERRIDPAEELEPTGAAGPAVEPLPLAPDRLAYLLHTSGSTGEPKAVAVSHSALAGAIADEVAALGLGPGARVLDLCSYAFDASFVELAVLAAGGSLHQADAAARRPGPELAALLAGRRITHLVSVPSVLAVTPPDALPELAVVTAGGEPMPAEVAASWGRPGRRLINAYGPTETAIAASRAEVAAGEPRPPIGRPRSGARVRVVDRAGRPVPIGVPGELWIGGTGVARGYAGRPAATAAAFVPDPFAERPGERLYRSGDLVRFLADGRLEFRGRFDRQIKVRGHRIEPAEVEAALVAHPGVREAVVVQGADGRLIGWVAPAGSGDGGESDLRRFLERRLPPPFVPAAIVRLEALPRTPSGKLDAAALPDPTPRPRHLRAGAAPSGAAERRLAQLFAEVLGVERVGRDDDFFALGGDSIQVIRLATLAAEAGLHLEPRQIFEQPTVAALAALAADAPRVVAEQGPVVGELPLTPIQRWFFARRLAAPERWAMALLLAAREVVPAALERALAAVVGHHDLLRARYPGTGVGADPLPRQEIAPPGAAPRPEVRTVDLRRLPPPAVRRAIATAAAAALGRLDLARGALIATVRLRLPDGDRLYLAVHHLVVDAVSWPILLGDLAAAYRASTAGEELALPPKTTSYATWARRLEAEAGSARLAAEAPYWRGVAAELARSAAAAPGRSPVASREGLSATGEAALDAATTAALDAAAEHRRATLEELVLAALAAAWGERHRRPLAVELEGHGREPLFEDVDVRRTVGWFTAPYPLVLDPPPEAGEAAVALARVKERLRAVPAGGVGWSLLRWGGGDPNLAAAAPPEVVLNVLGRADVGFDPDGPWRVAPEPAPLPRGSANRRPYRLDLTVYRLAGRLRVAWGADGDAGEEGAALAAATVAALGRLAAGDEETPLVAADFPHAGLAGDDLERLLGRVAGSEEER